MRWLAKLCTALCLVAGVHLAAQTGAISGQVIDQYGQPLPHAQVLVCSATSSGTPCTPTVPIYQDYNLTVPVSNPYTTDQYGNYALYVPALTFPNIYLVQVSPASGITWSYLFDGPGGTGGSGCITGGPVGTLVTSNGSGGCSTGYVQVNGTNLATPTPINFISSASVTVTNPGTGQIQFTSNSGPTIQTNGTPNTLQTLLNFVNPAAFNGISIAWSNPSGGQETFGLTGTLNNSGITNPQTTVNGQTCILGGSCTIGPGIAVEVNGTNLLTATPVNFTNSSSVIFTNPSAGVIQAAVAVAASFQMATPAPDTNNGVFITGTTCTPTTSNSALTALNTCGGSSGEMSSNPGGIFNHNVIITQVFQAPPLPSYINPANVIAVYAMAYTSQYGSAAYGFVCTGASNLRSAPVNTLTTTLMSGVTGSNFSSSTCTAQLSQSVYGTYGGFTVNQIGYWIEDNIDTLPTPANINVTPQLFFQANTNTLGVYLQNGLAPLLVSQLPDPFINSNDAYLVSDNTATSGACVGTGTPSGAPTLCYSTGAAWMFYRADLP